MSNEFPGKLPSSNVAYNIDYGKLSAMFAKSPISRCGGEVTIATRRLYSAGFRTASGCAFYLAEVASNGGS